MGNGLLLAQEADAIGNLAPRPQPYSVLPCLTIKPLYLDLHCITKLIQVKGKTEKKQKKENFQVELTACKRQKKKKKKSEETHQGYSQSSTFMQNLAKWEKLKKNKKNKKKWTEKDKPM